METTVDYRNTWIWKLPLSHARGLSMKQIEILKKNLDLYTLGDLFKHYPFRYEDRSIILEIRDFHFGLNYVQCLGEFKKFEILGEGKGRRLVGQFYDRTGVLDVVWFQKIEAVRSILKLNTPYLVYGKLQHFMGKSTLVHPEVEIYKPDEPRSGMESMYSSTETLHRFGLDSKGLSKIILWNLKFFKAQLKEPFSDSFIQKWGLMPLPEAIWQVHQPTNENSLEKAKERLKTEEIFPLQFFLLRKKTLNHTISQGFTFPKLEIFNQFYSEGLPFSLTNAQKKVLKEIRQDMLSGKQMNRLIQGDVGSGKTIVAFMAMLIAVDNGFQACLMAPTEILANQHFQSISKLAQNINVEVELLTGSSKTADRKRIAKGLEEGSIHILIGTHALIEEKVQFQQLGISVVDEQHRFGVAQRARLQSKNQNTLPPHVLVMTATPIPRTLAMSIYSDLDISVIDELPPGRIEIKTVHRTEGKRLRVFGFIKEQLLEGRQIYIVYPMIEESEALDLTNLMEGFESISRAFPNSPISIVHGKMKPKDKEFEMNRFLEGETKIMVATTVIEVGVNVPNASIMVVENSERFGLTQLHQLRGRVGRGKYQSYCILMTGQKVSREGKVRIETLCRTTNGFEIAETDLKLRGPGDLMGTKQSGIADLKLTNLSTDGLLIEKIRAHVAEFIETDQNLELPENQLLKSHLEALHHNKSYWSQIA